MAILQPELPRTVLPEQAAIAVERLSSRLSPLRLNSWTIKRGGLCTQWGATTHQKNAQSQQLALVAQLTEAGLRRAEVANLKVSDIDTARNVVHVLGGKGRKDRDVMLRPKLLEFPAPRSGD